MLQEKPNQDTLMQQSVKHSNRTVITHNAIENPRQLLGMNTCICCTIPWAHLAC